MDSTYSSIYPASYCIDGDTDTMCHNLAYGGWLEIDLGSNSSVAMIEVYNRQVAPRVCHNKRFHFHLDVDIIVSTGLLRRSNRRIFDSVVDWRKPNRNNDLGISL